MCSSKLYSLIAGVDSSINVFRYLSVIGREHNKIRRIEYQCNLMGIVVSKQIWYEVVTVLHLARNNKVFWSLEKLSILSMAEVKKTQGALDAW